NIFDLIGKKWMLVTAGDKESYNTMTASWGGVGVLWNKNVAFSFIRPQRYTFEFLESNSSYTLSFYNVDWKKSLSLCGSNSGRDIDKAKETGLIPVFNQNAPYFEQAKLVLVCKKLYGQFLNKESIIDSELTGSYTNNDYHKMYVGEIVKVLIKED
ncbi:MAG: flavin reductase, partial [Oscillospiraceae bacterium]